LSDASGKLSGHLPRDLGESLMAVAFQLVIDWDEGVDHYAVAMKDPACLP
jgi:hypothetical protein